MAKDYAAGTDMNLVAVGGTTQTADDTIADIETAKATLVLMNGKITKVDTDNVKIVTNKLVTASSMTTTALTLNTTTASILAANTNRKGFAIYNNTEGAIVYLGASATVGFPILWKGSYSDSGQGVYTGAVVALSSTAGTNVRIIETS